MPSDRCHLLAATGPLSPACASPQVRKVLARSLRHVAHSHGASLVFLGGLAGGGAGHKEAAADKALLANFRAMLNHLVFTGLDKRMWVLGAVLVARVRLTALRPYLLSWGAIAVQTACSFKWAPLCVHCIAEQQHPQAMPAQRHCCVRTQGHLRVLSPWRCAWTATQTISPPVDS